MQDFLARDLDHPREATIAGQVDLPESHVLDDLLLNMELDGQRVNIVNAFWAMNANGDFELTVRDLPIRHVRGRGPFRDVRGRIARFQPGARVFTAAWDSRHRHPS